MSPRPTWWTERRRTGQRSSLVRRFAVLLVISIAAVIGLGASAVAITRGAVASGRTTDAANRLLTHEQLADTRQDELRGDVLALMSSHTEDARAEHVAAAATHRRELETSLASARLVVENELAWPDLTVRMRAASAVLTTYADAAVRLTETASTSQHPDTDPAITAELHGVETQFERADSAQHDLLDTISRRVDAARAHDLALRARSTTVAAGVAGLAVLLVVGLGLAVFRDVLRTVRARMVADQRSTDLSAQAAREARRHSFAVELHDGFEAATTERDAYDIVARALDEISPNFEGELLVADSSEAHLARVATTSIGAAGCSVTTPGDCVAVRRGSRTHFASSESLAACPRLRDRPDGEIGAHCVPVAFMGRSLGVLHVTSAPNRPEDPERAHRLASLADQTGARVGTLRAFAQAQVQASTDGLTGLLNRRTLEDRARPLVESDRPFAVLMADLDHFKSVNDTYGHETGDRALRCFAAVLKRVVRRDDLACRFGGEEFVVLLPEADVTTATTIANRIREDLGLSAAASNLPALTVSIGVADSQEGDDLTAVVGAADVRLLSAKRNGRNRVEGPGAEPALVADPLPEPTR